MVYDPNTPENADEPPDVSQKKITANFQWLQTFLKSNHSDIATTDEGKHNFLTMPKQDPAPTPAGGEMALYVKQPDSSVNKLFLFLKDQDGTEKEVLPKETAERNGKLVMPGGLIFLWGEAPNSRDAQGYISVTFHTLGFPHHAFHLSVTFFNYVGRISGSGFWNIKLLEKDRFRVNAGNLFPSSGTIRYFAIGN